MDRPKGLLLIVEDDGRTRYALTRLLGQDGWTVLAVPTVAQGLALLPSAPVCIILDLMLPDGTGEHVLREVREVGLDSRVIICTAVTDESRLDGLESLRPDAVVRKPIEMKELLGACSG